MELETDKAVVEVPSSVSGTVQEIRVKEGDKIKVGQVIFTVERRGSESVCAASRTSSCRRACDNKRSPSPHRLNRRRQLPRLLRTRHHPLLQP